jgi:hypothetical protein
MKNILRHIIREQIEKIFEAEELSPIEQMIKNQQINIEKSIKTLEQDIENSEKLLNTDKQAKGNSPSTITIGGKTIPNRKRKELEIGTNIEDKAIKAKEDYLKDLEKSQEEIDKLADEAAKDRAEAEAKEKTSVLPSTDSPI